MTVIFPLTSLTAIQNWVSAGNAASAIPPTESLRLFVDAAWMAGTPESKRFTLQAERFLDRLEQGNWKNENRLPKNILRYLEKLSKEELERMKKFLALDTSLRENAIGEPVHGHQLIGDPERFSNTNNPLKNLTEEEWKKLESEGKLIQRNERNGVTLEMHFTRLDDHFIHVEMIFLTSINFPFTAEAPLFLVQLRQLTRQGSLHSASQDESYQNDLRRAIELAEQVAKKAHNAKDIATEWQALEFKAEALGKLGRWREKIRVRWRQVVATRRGPPISHIVTLMSLGSDYLAIEEFEKGALTFRQAARVCIDNPSPLRRHQERLIEIREMEALAWRMAGKEGATP